MTEESSQKKVVGRKVALALGLVCIVLAASLVSVLAVYFSGAFNSSEVASLKAENASLQKNVTDLQDQLASLSNLYIQAKSQNSTETDALISELQNQTAAQQTALDLGYLQDIIQNADVQLTPGGNQTLNDGVVAYAGYFKVHVTSNSPTTFVELIYSYGAYGFDYKVIAGTDSTVALPVLPSLINLILGNTETTNNVTATVSATYVY